jgi:hypothetical protein
MIPQLVAESISKFKPAKSMHVRSVGHKIGALRLGMMVFRNISASVSTKDTA